MSIKDMRPMGGYLALPETEFIPVLCTDHRYLSEEKQEDIYLDLTREIDSVLEEKDHRQGPHHNTKKGQKCS